ncbi:hypothetical protein R3P38DRAFT_477630 [Favolaschia claudopus]|uniref:RING-type domain-containing protein n=1 Tax=Favolaschia claudopus TaxID=2862362 RepID=A0AAW0CJQ6_9AGAR
MGQAASTPSIRRPRQRAQHLEQRQEQPQQRSRRRSLRSLIPKRRHNSIISAPDSPDVGTGSRRGSRRWSRALSFRASPPPSPLAPEPPVVVVQEPPDPEEVQVRVLSPDHDSNDGEAADPLSDVDEHDDEDDEDESPRVRPPTPMPQRTPTPPPPQIPPTPPQQQHRFPLPGTLVVVQGVVHTTDIPPASTDSNNSAPGAPSNPVPAISSSSIDVLGTLLTVAAQATAASLLTGSSDSLLRAQSQSQSHLQPTPVASPYSPTSTSPSSYASPSHPRTPFPPYRPTSLPPPTNSNSSPAVNGNGVGTDERATMLAEMARAFNLGLGLGAPRARSATTTNSDASNANANPGQGDGTRAGGEREEAREGTFERFLVDLQVDLRGALGGARSNNDISASATEGEREDGRAESEGEGERERGAPDVETGELMTENGSEPVEAHREASASGDEEKDRSSESESDGIEEERLEREGTSTPATPATTLEEPETEAAAEVSSTSAPSEEPTSAPSQESVTPTAVETEFTTPTPTLPTATSTSTTNPSAVNWWRLYRFPAIGSRPSSSLPVSVQIPVPTAAGTGAAGETGALPVPVALDNVSQTPVLAATPLSPSEAPPASQRQTVVPVIVVGLQSVTLGAAMGMFGQHVHAHPGAHTQIHPHPGGVGVVPGFEAPTPVVPTQTQTQTEAAMQTQTQVAEDSSSSTLDAAERAARRRSWWRPRPTSSLLGSRRASGGPGDRVVGLGLDDNAASAPSLPFPAEDGNVNVVAAEGEGPEETTAPTLAGAAAGLAAAASDASRTFLIYVIGGYYPPEHGLLNGAGGAESLEALFRELPELLGYARPPTASKADIARSGLAVISPAALSQAEKEGRVLETCVERCLICLDEYESEDEIRVLNCRHAFHLGCVDRWLETGRNNCPACRTKGVSTDPLSPSAAAAPAQA